jgi:hypothetical protein
MSIRFGSYIRDRSRAAGWLFDRRDKAMLWGWAVLTAHNQDRETLGLSDVTAYQIFTDLTERGLLVPFVGDDRAETYRLNLGLQSEWRAVIEPPGVFRRYIAPTFAWCFRNFYGFVIWLASVIIAAWIGSWLKK